MIEPHIFSACEKHTYPKDKCPCCEIETLKAEVARLTDERDAWHNSNSALLVENKGLRAQLAKHHGKVLHCFCGYEAAPPAAPMSDGQVNELHSRFHAAPTLDPWDYSDRGDYCTCGHSIHAHHCDHEGCLCEGYKDKVVDPVCECGHPQSDHWYDHGCCKGKPGTGRYCECAEFKAKGGEQ